MFSLLCMTVWICS